MSNEKKRKSEEISQQEQAQVKDNQLLALKFHEEAEALFNDILECPELWATPALQYLREFVEKIKNDPKKYPPRTGDVGSLLPDASGHDGLSTGFVAACAAGDHINDGRTPILQVLSKDSKHKAGYRKDPARKFVDMKLMDGDCNTIHARLATHTTDLGRLIKVGNVIQLELFNDLKYHLDGNSKEMPWLLINKFTILGKDPLPAVSNVKDPLPMGGIVASATQESSAQSAHMESSTDGAADIEMCTEDNRLCSIYGTKFKICICDCMPVEDVDLDDIAEDCHFAGAVSKMEPNHKRNLLYWYYATNVYLICGAHNRKELPSCLVSKIRKLYPSPDGKITGYKDSPNYV